MVASLQVDSSMAPRYPCKFPLEIVGHHSMEPGCHSVELTFPDVESAAAAVAVAPVEPPSVAVPAFFEFVEIVEAKTVVVHQDLTMNYQYHYSMLSVAADAVVTAEFDPPLQMFVLMMQTRYHADALAGYCTSAAGFACKMIVDHQLNTAAVVHYSYLAAADVVAVDKYYFAPA